MALDGAFWYVQQPRDIVNASFLQVEKRDYLSLDIGQPVEASRQLNTLQNIASAAFLRKTPGCNGVLRRRT